MTLTDWSNVAVVIASLAIIAWVVRDARQYAKRATVEAEQDATTEQTAFAPQSPVRRESIQEVIERVNSSEHLNELRWM